MSHTYFDISICDSTIPNPMLGQAEELSQNISKMMEYFEWEISRESIKKPLHGPMHIICGKTYEAQWKFIENGSVGQRQHLNVEGFASGDYLSSDLSAKAQIELLHGIGTRVVHACIAAKGEHATQLIWGSLPKASRVLTTRGLLMLVTARVDWV